MKRGTWLSILALLIALAGAAVAIAVYLKQLSCCDEYDDDEFEDEIDDGAYCVSPCTDADEDNVSQEAVVVDSEDKMSPSTEPKDVSADAEEKAEN